MSDIPQSVVDLNPKFGDGIFNGPVKTKRQLDGYAIDADESVLQPPRLVHDPAMMLYWCRGEADPQAAVDLILANSYQMSPSEYKAEKANPLSEWYVDESAPV
jgi:hypothetical protein